jgi:F420-non-reducing hydrogenase large subunit
VGRIITIDPITRLEGHGKISIILNDAGDVEKAYMQVPELRGFERFCIGRPAEEMPQITSRICGVCPTAHHMAGTLALDSLFNVSPTKEADAIRELFYNLFMFEDHTIHFYFLGGPDFIVGPDAPAGQRNILGVIDKVGVDIGKKVILMRKRCRNLMAQIGGKAIHPVLGLPGGVSKQISKETHDELKLFSKDAVEFAKFTLQAFSDIVLNNKQYLELIQSDMYSHNTHYMGTVDKNEKVNFYRGAQRIIGPSGNIVDEFSPKDYTSHIAERVEEWSYIKFPYAKKIGWKGFVDGDDSGIMRVGPLARLNVSKGMATPAAQADYETMYAALGAKNHVSHSTLAIHYARLVELLYAAERVDELAQNDAIRSDNTRNMNLGTPSEGVGIIEAPRGTLLHHYQSDERGILTKVNLIVATVFNSPSMCMSIEKVAKNIIKKGQVNDGLLNMVEMAFRAYDPCLSCATHSLPGKMPLIVELLDKNKKQIQKITRDSAGDEQIEYNKK